MSGIKEMLNRSTYAMIKGLQENLVGERPRKITRQQIRRAIESPYENIRLLQQASVLMQTSNGIYNEVITHQSNMLTNDYFLKPINIGKVKTKEEMEKLYVDISAFISKYNIKYKTNWIIRRVIEQGELYICKVETSDGIVLQELPASYCKITRKENDVFRFAIDLNKITDRTLDYMPVEIQKAYKKFKNSKGKKDKNIIDSSYYQVSEIGVAFPINESYSKNIPYYSCAFDDFIELENKKDLQNNQDVLDSIVLIHQKCPYDKDNGKVLISTKQATAIHNATKQNLPTNAKIVTHHLDIDLLRLSDGSKSFNESVKSATDNAYQSAGINAELFNGKKNNNEAIVAGIVEDSLLPFRIQEMVANWINYELSKTKKKGVQFIIHFIDSTKYNKDAKIKSAREDLSAGGSYVEFLATKGHDVQSAIALGKMEKLLELDSIFAPKQTAHTLSANSGRPINDKGTSNVDTSNTDTTGGEE